MLKPVYTKQFDKDVKISLKRNKDIIKLKEIIKKLINQEILDEKYHFHKLKGNFKDRMECHIEPDWLLIFKIEEYTIIFERTGTHSDLFR